MSVQIIVPELGESVSEATVVKWFKTIGEIIVADEPLLELETDKVTVEVPAPDSGVLTEIVAAAGIEVAVGETLGRLDICATDNLIAADETTSPACAATIDKPGITSNRKLSPAVRKLIDDFKLDPSAIQPTGKKGQITKADVTALIKENSVTPKIFSTTSKLESHPRSVVATRTSGSENILSSRPNDKREEIVKMSRLRQSIARRLKEAQNTAAILTTYNEVDMTALLALRSEYRDSFEKKYNVRLGFMSFFVKASIAALKEFPAMNAEVFGDQIVYKNYYDISVAVGTPKGLVVPVLRDADKMSFADIEQNIADFGRRALDGTLSLAELTGGTFTISNGGVYGSLMSMPILNPPQTGVLGMHKIQKRPMVVSDDIKIREMMYLALSYDHRIVDGREAVTFLVRLKESIEDPQRLLIDV